MLDLLVRIDIDDWSINPFVVVEGNVVGSSGEGLRPIETLLDVVVMGDKAIFLPAMTPMAERCLRIFSHSLSTRLILFIVVTKFDYKLLCCLSRDVVHLGK